MIGFINDATGRGIARSLTGDMPVSMALGPEVNYREIT
jgi:hypothetical protein